MKFKLQVSGWDTYLSEYNHNTTDTSCVIVNNILSPDEVAEIMNVGFDTHIVIESSSTRRVSKTATWHGFIKSLGNMDIMKYFITNCVVRSNGATPLKYDYTMCSWWIDAMKTECEAFKRVDRELMRIYDTLCGNHFSWHILYTMPSCPAQNTHCDSYDAKRQSFYITCMIPLYPGTQLAGGTYFVNEDDEFFHIGSCCIFDGNTLHHGTKNKSRHPRISLFFVMSNAKFDENDIY